MKWPWNRKQSMSMTGGLGVGDGTRFLHPLDPPLSPRMTSQESRDAVRRAITELYEHDALDAGNGDVVDAWIDQLRPQWLAHQRMVSADRDAAARLAAGEYEAAAVASRRVAEARKAELDRTERLISIYEDQLFGRRHVAPLDHADLRRRPRPTVSSLEGLTPQWRWRAISLLLLALAAAGDLASFYVTLAAMLAQSSGMMVWTLTAAVTAAAVGVMHVVGRTARNLREGQGGLGRMALVLMTVSWVALGAAAFYVRTQVSPPSTAGGDVVFGADATAAPSDHPLLSALLLGALFLGSGVLAYWIGFSEHHPRMTSYLRLRRDLTRQQKKATEAERHAIEAERLSANAEAEIRRTAERNAAASASVEAEIAELKELARLHIAGLVGEPPATNNLVTGRSAEKTANLAAISTSEPFPSIPLQTGEPQSNDSRNGNRHSPLH